MNGPLAKAIRAAMEKATIKVAVELPDRVTSDFGEHEVWYAWDEDGLFAAIAILGLFPFLFVSGGDLSCAEAVGWRVDLPTSEIERLYTLKREVHDLSKNNSKPLAKAENW
jgi:hypothetical protein